MAPKAANTANIGSPTSSRRERRGRGRGAAASPARSGGRGRRRWRLVGSGTAAPTSSKRGRIRSAPPSGGPRSPRGHWPARPGPRRSSPGGPGSAPARRGAGNAAPDAHYPDSTGHGSSPPDRPGKTRSDAAHGAARRASSTRGQAAVCRIRPSSAGSVSGASRSAASSARVTGRPASRGMALDRADPGMGVLHVPYGIVARLLGHLGEVEVERRVVLAGQHDEADDVLADLLDHVAQGDDPAGALRHPERLAAVQQVDQLADLDVELRPAPRSAPGRPACMRLM